MAFVEARLRVQFVQLLHGADAERRGRVAQAQGVGREVEDHRAHGRVIGGHVREQPDHERPDEPGEQAEKPPASATFISPRNRVITPTRPMPARVTAPEAA